MVLAVTVTHHISAFALAAILGLWFLVMLILRTPRTERRYIGPFAILVGTTSLTWFFLVAKPAASYIISQNLTPGLKEIQAMALKASAGRKLYGGGGGFTPPPWYELAGLAAVAIVTIGLIPAIFRAYMLFSTRRSDNLPYPRAPVIVMALIAASFPFTLLPRLTADGGALSSRTAEYVFTGIGCTLGLLAMDCTMHARYFRRLSQAVNWCFAAWRGTILLAVMMTVVFAGDVTVSNPYTALLPSSSHPTGYPSSVQPYVITASNWARVHLGSGQPFASDLIDSFALSTNGNENPVSAGTAYPIFFSATLDGATAALIRADKVRYIFADWNMRYGSAANAGGYYFSTWEPNSGKPGNVFPAVGLAKFTMYTCSHMIYHAGPVEIFNVTGIENGTCDPKLLAAKKGRS